MQESNKKYNELLTEKLNMEDKLKKDFDQERKELIKEWQRKCEETALLARQQEKDAAKQVLSNTISDYNKRLASLEETIADLK